MSVRRVAAAVCVLVAASLAGGCEGVIDPSKNTIEEFKGTLAVGGALLHEFSVSKNGEFEIKITQLAPNADVFLGLQYGPSQSGGCGVYQSNPFAQLNRIALAGPISSGRYCLLVSDTGALGQATTYTLRVSHP